MHEPESALQNGRMLRRTALCSLAGLVLVGCTSEQVPSGRPVSEPSASQASPTPQDNRPVIVAFGNSLSAGFGVDPGKSYPDFLQKQLDDAGLSYRVLNAGIGGDTTSGGLARVDSIAAMKPATVIIELGGNDGLRGLPIETTRANLEQIIAYLQKAGARVVLAGMTLPPNYGPDYIVEFEKLFRELATKHKVPLVNFFEGIIGRSDLMQRDGIHPTVEGNRVTAQNVFRVIAPLLK